MKTYHVGFDQVARIAHVAASSGAVPGGTTALGSFQIPTDLEDDLGYFQDSYTVYHGVRDKLYAIGEQNMQAVQIKMV